MFSDKHKIHKETITEAKTLKRFITQNEAIKRFHLGRRRFMKYVCLRGCLQLAYHE